MLVLLDMYYQGVVINEQECVERRTKARLFFFSEFSLTATPWRNGSASDSRSEGCVFKSRRGQIKFFTIIFPSFTINLRGYLHFHTTFKICVKSLSITCFPRSFYAFILKSGRKWKYVPTFIRKVFWIILICSYLNYLK